MTDEKRRRDVDRFDADDEWISAQPFERPPSDLLHLPIECVVYVPSTQGVDGPIGEDAFRGRRDETARFLVTLFGGCRETMVKGRYVDDDGQVVEEDVAVVTGFGTEEDYGDKRARLLDWLIARKADWGQEAIGFEFEGDLWYI